MKETILIVDDMEINRVILAEGFKESYEVLEAENGEEAIAMLDKTPGSLRCCSIWSCPSKADWTCCGT